MLYAKAFWARIVVAAQARVVEIQTRDLFVTLASDIVSRNQINQKLKLMVKSQDMLHTPTLN